MTTLGLSDEHNGALADRLLAAVRETVGRGEKIGVPFGTDAAVFSAAGVPTVVFGPGSIAQAHTADEWLPLDELAQASEVLYRFAREGLAPPFRSLRSRSLTFAHFLESIETSPGSAKANLHPCVAARPGFLVYHPPKASAAQRAARPSSFLLASGVLRAPQKQMLLV